MALAAIVGAVALSLAAAHAALAADRTVAMSGIQFVPASVTLNAGDTVTWRNDDGIAHSARADNGSFDTGIFSSGSRSHTFTQAGSFGYFCAVHPSTMRGTVTVVAAATPAPSPSPTPRPATAPPTPAPTTAPPATASPTPAPSATASPSAAPAATVTPAPSPLAAQATPTPTGGSSRAGDGDATPLVAAAVAAGIALTGVAFWAIRRR